MSQKHFGALVYKKRKALGKRQKHLARAAGITQGTISKLEAGRAHPSFLQAVRVCRTLKIQPTRAFKAILA